MGEETLHLGEDRIGSLLFDVQNDENSSFKVVNVLESNSILLDAFDEVIGSFQFYIWVGEFYVLMIFRDLWDLFTAKKLHHSLYTRVIKAF